ncbi:MAG: hypothetical protein GX652_04915 [Burkholderiaceae bacterium]|nr:hypothetical protein [Burkholderiaceae bacterium]
MSAFGDIMGGLKTVMALTDKVEALSKDADLLRGELRDIDRRLVRVETVIEITRSDGVTLRIAKDPD